MLALAAEAELAKRTVADDRQKQIKDLHDELLKQQAAQINSRGEVKVMEDEFALVLNRYRELRGTGTTPAPEAAPAPATTPQAPATPSK